jgi:DNA-binding protein HU-beta
MNKSELVTAVAERSGVSKADVERTLKAFEEIVQQTLSKGKEAITIPGFLKFEQGKRAARTGVNPRTGESVKYPAKKTAKVSVGATLKAIANGDKPAPK